jgi:8-oxo-dGTP diphosphatase
MHCHPRPMSTKPSPVARHKRIAATMLITDPTGRVLVVKPTYKPGWELPGGRVEHDESPATAASREVDEELGLARAPRRLLALDYVPATDALIVVFDGGTLDDTIRFRLPPDELSDARFVEPDRLDELLPRLKARRARAALDARAAGCAVYLEDGRT